MRPAIFSTLLLVCFLSCSRNNEETTTTGHLHVLVSESVAPVMIPQVAEFMNLYKERGADVAYTIVRSEAGNRKFIDDTARLIITTIPLTEAQKAVVNKTTDQLVEITVAYQGIAAIVSLQNKVEELSLGQVRDILAGSLTRWGQLHRARVPQGDIHIVLEDSSDVAEYLVHRLTGGSGIRASLRRTHTPLEVVTAVAKDRLAIGFVESCWVDSVKEGTNVLALSADSTLADTTFKPPAESVGKYYDPHPAYLYLNYYPMKRAVYLYARTSTGDFATGFASFVASSAGQKIFLQKGLLPGTQKIVLKPTN
ncbi:MAG TPA: substrate-binding domain-containing protein [Bacteroidota bacterium]|nr:substrate-binding domain-containing protein [Bacteroidota bacterium]